MVPVRTRRVAYQSQDGKQDAGIVPFHIPPRE